MLKYTFKTLSRNQLRSLLTALGVIIGVWSVILLVSIGNGLKVYIEQQFEVLGTNLLWVMPGSYLNEEGEIRASADWGAVSGAEFKEEQVGDLQKIQGIKSVIPSNFKTSAISYGREKIIADVLGTTIEIEEARNLTPEKGRFFNEAEQRRGRRVVVIGAQIKEDLFGDENPIEKTIEIENRRFTVIGLLPEKGGAAAGGVGLSTDNQLVAPYKAVWDLTDNKTFSYIFLEAESKDKIDTVKKQAEEILSKEFDEGEFSVADQAELLSVFSEVLNMVTIGLAGIAAISLIVGGIGIMNTMYVTVAERTREVGLRKAVGATNKNIRNQFLIESAILSISGGIIGLLLSLGSILIIRNFFPAQLTIWSVFLALGVSTLVGIIFGLAPARRASKLTPVEALRYE
jgi:putative ABC transport system permease protein